MLRRKTYLIDIVGLYFIWIEDELGLVVVLCFFSLLIGERLLSFLIRLFAFLVFIKDFFGIYI